MASSSRKRSRKSSRSSKTRTKTRRQDSWDAAGYGAAYSSLKPGDVVNHWQIQHKLGEGGMGSVWAAQHLVNGRKAAIKVMLPEGAKDAFAVELFGREGEVDNIVDHAIGRLPKTGAVEVYDNGVLADGSPYMVMEILEGDDLDGLLRKGRLNQADVLEVTDQALRVLEAAHQRGIVHRDLKPGNIFREKDGGVRVLDWGLASKIGAKDFNPNSVIGTPGFMAPEQAQGGGRYAGPEADIFGISATMYALLSGRVPATSVEDTAACSITPIEQVAPNVPAYLAGIINKGLSCNPKNRYHSAAEMLQDLEPIVAGLRVHRQYPHVEAAVQEQLARAGLG